MTKLLAYHGSQHKKFNFNENKVLYLTTDKEKAISYAKREWDEGLIEGEIPVVYTFEVSIENPYRTKGTEKEFFYFCDSEMNEYGKEDLIEKGYDSIIHNDLIGVFYPNQVEFKELQILPKSHEYYYTNEDGIDPNDVDDYYYDEEELNESVEDNFNSNINCKVVLKDGRTIYGKFIDKWEDNTGKGIFIKSDSANKIKENDIKELYMYYDCEVILKDGRKIYGNFVGDYGDHRLHLDDAFNRKGWAIKDEFIDKVNYKRVLKKELNEGILGALTGGLIGKKYKHPYIGAYIGHKIQDKFFNSKNKEDKIDYKKIIYNEIFNDLKNKKMTIDTAIDMLIDNKIAKDYDDAIDIVDFWCYEYGLDKSLNESIKEKILYIIRGVPGSGKSTLAHKLTDNVVEADQFFYDDEGNYNWRADKLHWVHRQCFETVKKYMEEGRDKIAVANTFVKIKDYKNYVELAEQFGYKVDIRVCNGNYKSIHNVPEETIEKMKRKFQLDESIAYASKKDLSDIILKNPTRKELKDNNLVQCRCMEDSEGNWYFADMENMLHRYIVVALSDEAYFPLFDGNDCYGIAYYDSESNEFWYNLNDYMYRQECIEQYKNSEYLSTTFPNARIIPNPWNNQVYDELYDDEEQLNESINDKPKVGDLYVCTSQNKYWKDDKTNTLWKITDIISNGTIILLNKMADDKTVNMDEGMFIAKNDLNKEFIKHSDYQGNDTQLDESINDKPKVGDLYVCKIGDETYQRSLWKITAISNDKEFYTITRIENPNPNNKAYLSVNKITLPKWFEKYKDYQGTDTELDESINDKPKVGDIYELQITENKGQLFEVTKKLPNNFYELTSLTRSKGHPLGYVEYLEISEKNLLNWFRRYDDYKYEGDDTVLDESKYNKDINVKEFRNNLIGIELEPNERFGKCKIVDVYSTYMFNGWENLFRIEEEDTGKQILVTLDEMKDIFHFDIEKYDTDGYYNGADTELDESEEKIWPDGSKFVAKDGIWQIYGNDGKSYDLMQLRDDGIKIKWKLSMSGFPGKDLIPYEKNNYEGNDTELDESFNHFNFDVDDEVEDKKTGEVWTITSIEPNWVWIKKDFDDSRQLGDVVRKEVFENRFILFKKNKLSQYSKYNGDDTELDESLILKEGIEEVKKYYKNIPDDMFQTLVDLDPTYQGGNVLGKFGKWILNLYNKKLLKDEDFYKVTEYLITFKDNLSKMPNKDIMSYKTLPDLAKAIQPFEGQKDVSNKQKSRDAKKGGKKILETNEWLVICPKTEEAACYYGANTKWCTAAKNDNMFDVYNREGPLYIFINKQNNEKYQMHAQSLSFMNELDEPVPPLKVINDKKVQDLIKEILDHERDDINFYDYRPLEGLNWGEADAYIATGVFNLMAVLFSTTKQTYKMLDVLKAYLIDYRPNVEYIEQLYCDFNGLEMSTEEIKKACESLETTNNAEYEDIMLEIKQTMMNQINEASPYFKIYAIKYDDNYDELELFVKTADGTSDYIDIILNWFLNENSYFEAGHILDEIGSYIKKPRTNFTELTSMFCKFIDELVDEQKELKSMKESIIKNPSIEDIQQMLKEQDLGFTFNPIKNDLTIYKDISFLKESNDISGILSPKVAEVKTDDEEYTRKALSNTLKKIYPSGYQLIIY